MCYGKQTNNLNFVGIAYDVYDGQQPHGTLSKDSKQLALTNKPSILEIFGHCLFPAAFIVGPQFPMKKYQNFVSGQFSDEVGINCTAALWKFRRYMQNIANFSNHVIVLNRGVTIFFNL